MIDIVLRDCGHGEFLPIINVAATGRELYRGDRVNSPEKALSKAIAAWAERATGNIREFRQRQENGL
jgi:hypothetical protein